MMSETSPLKIAYMTGEYPRATDTFIQREVAALRARGVEVSTFSIRRPSSKEHVAADVQAERDRTFFVLEAGIGKFLTSHFKLLLTHPLDYLKSALLAWRTRPPGFKAMIWQMFYFAEAGVVAQRVKELQAVHLHNHFSNSSCSAAMIAATMGRFTYSVTMHGPHEFFEPMYWRIDEKAKRALFVACISHFCRSQAMIFAPQDKWKSMHIVHCGVNPSLFKPVTHTGKGTRLLFCGRLAAVKGLPVLIEALAKIVAQRPDVTLTIAGDGPDRKRIEQQIAELKLTNNVRILGYQSQDQVRDLLMNKTDVFVLASFAEGVPVVLMEALAAGVPVVTTRIAGIAELVEDGKSGYLTPPGDVDTLTGYIITLLDDPDLRNRMGQVGRQKIEKEFDIDKEAAWLCDVLTSATRGQILPIRPPDDRAE